MSESTMDANARRLLDDLDAPGCPACTRRVEFDPDYRSWFFAERYQQRELQDALTDSLSVCAEHAHYLRADAGGRAQLVHVHELLARRLLDRLDRDDRSFFRDALEEPCPACESRDDATDRAVYFLRSGLEAAGVEAYGDPGVCCLPHARRLFADVEPELVPALLRAQADALLEARDRLDAADVSDGHQEPVDAALRATVGHAPATLDPEPVSEPTDSRDPVAAFARILHDGAACPVCREVAHARREWVAWLDANAGSDGDRSDVLPQCREHAWACARVGSPALGREVARATIDPRLELLERADERLDTGGSSRVGALAGALGRQSAVEDALDSLRPVPCPVCERVETARERALDLLFALLEREEHQEAFTSGYGLCLDHFARALARDPGAAVADVLIKDATATLRRLHWELAEAKRKSAWDTRPETTGAEGTAGWRAVTRFAGARYPE